MKSFTGSTEYMTRQEVEGYLSVSARRVYQLRDTGMIKALKGGVYDSESVKAYEIKRGDKKGGRYRAQDP